MSSTILVVDDEKNIRETLAEYLSGQGFQVTTAPNGEHALELTQSTRFDVVLCDVNMPGLDGIQVLEKLSRTSPETYVILITAYATVETAVEAFTKGAHDYLMKPIILHDVLSKIRRLLETRHLFQENQWLRRELQRSSDPEILIGKAPEIRKAYDLARKVAPMPSTVLILGESGTGKEVLARAIHRFAQEKKPTDGRFLPINCAAIPHDLLENQLFGHRRGAYTGADKDADGLFVHAGAGTVFLDEIAEIPLATQAKLLRAIESKEVFPVGANEPVKVEARILAATNKNLENEVKQGRFREDLFYRLNVVNITLPPLRERREDLPELADFLLSKHARSMAKKFTGISHAAMQLLLSHSWKGNIRELDNVIQRAVILGEGPLVQPDDLPPDVRPLPNDPHGVDDLNEAVTRFECQHIERILRATSDKREAAKRMGIGLSSLYRKMDICGISLKSEQPTD
ncbi:MAG: sigma-54-dependent transcriptional regulator [Fimbriiglobus sp.]